MAENRKLHTHNLAVAQGFLEGVEVVNIFGFNNAIDGAFLPSWENNTAYTYPGSALTMSVQSNNGADTVVSILIQGLDSDYMQIEEIVALNGVTSVNTVNQYLRINNVVTVAGNAVGTVTIENAATVYAQIDPGIGKSQMSLYTVPADCKFYLYRINAWSATTTGASQYLIFRNWTQNANGVQIAAAETTFDKEMNVVRVFPFVYQPKTDIQFQARSSSGTNEIGLFAEGLLIRST